MLMDVAVEIIDQLSVVDCIGFTKTRVGPPNDGGYVVLDELCKKTSTLYTVGVGNDVGFELDFIKKYPSTDKVFLFDPSIKALPETHNKFSFLKKGVPQICHSPGFSHAPKGSILKMDVEWNEWETLEILLSKDQLKLFDQIIIEFHFFTVEPQLGNKYSQYFNNILQHFRDLVNEKILTRYLNILMAVKDQFHIYHIHANNSLALQRMNYRDFPVLLEASLVRKECVGDVSKSAGPFPHPALDRPNKTDRPDILNYKSFLPL